LTQSALTQQGARPVAVVSGGSSGIGLEVARLLRGRGYALHLLARDPVRLAAAQDALMAGLSPADTPRPILHALDVADEEACARVCADILAQSGRVDWLVTCAGTVTPGLFLDLPLAVHRQQMTTNYFGTLNLVLPMARHMASRASGRITLVASAVNFGAVAGLSGYTPGKDAVFGLGETLHIELAALGVHVSVAAPSDTDTPQLARERAERPAITNRIAAGGGEMSAPAVARAIVEGTEAGRFLIAPGHLMRLYSVFFSLIAPVLRWRQKRILLEAHEAVSNKKPKVQ
jgi:3-dehydrosphinganine reductase